MPRGRAMGATWGPDNGVYLVATLDEAVRLLDVPLDQVRAVADQVVTLPDAEGRPLWSVAQLNRALGRAKRDRNNTHHNDNLWKARPYPTRARIRVG